MLVGESKPINHLLNLHLLILPYNHLSPPTRPQLSLVLIRNQYFPLTTLDLGYDYTNSLSAENPAIISVQAIRLISRRFRP